MSLPPVIKSRIQLLQIANQVGAYHLCVLTVLLIGKAHKGDAKGRLCEALKSNYKIKGDEE